MSVKVHSDQRVNGPTVAIPKVQQQIGQADGETHAGSGAKHARDEILLEEIKPNAKPAC